MRNDDPAMPVAVHWYSWHQIPFDGELPALFPGQGRLFKEGVAELQKAGVRVMPYINEMLWDYGARRFQEPEGIEGAAKYPEGETYIETYGSGAKLAPMCADDGDLAATRCRDRDAAGDRVRGRWGVYRPGRGRCPPRRATTNRTATHSAAAATGRRQGYWPLLTELRRQIKAAGLEKFLPPSATGSPTSTASTGISPGISGPPRPGAAFRLRLCRAHPAFLA